MTLDTTAHDLRNVIFRNYRADDLKPCARLAQEAFPYGRETDSRSQAEMSMEGYVESSLLWSNWSEVACVGETVVGLLFGRIESSWKERSRLRNVSLELRMMARWILRNPLALARSFGLMWNVWMTELRLMGHKPRSDAEIELLIVGAQHRGKGIGRELVGRFLEAARRSGANLVTVYTENLQSDYQFYEKYGFRRVATFHDDVTSYFANQDSTAIVFALDLGQSPETVKKTKT